MAGELLKNYSGSCRWLRTVTSALPRTLLRITTGSDRRYPRVVLVRYSPYKTVRRCGNPRGWPFPQPFGPFVACGPRRSKTFPALSNSYKAQHASGLYIEWVTDGTLGALSNTRRSVAQRGVPKRTSARGFLGRPFAFSPSLAFPPRSSMPASNAPAHPLQPGVRVEPRPLS